MKHVLIADDHSVTRRALRELVKEAFPACEVAEVGTGFDALKLLEQQPWSLILLDVSMPGPGILELIAAVRVALPEVPVLVVTALTEVEYVFQVINAGANGLVHKHFASDDLLHAITAVANGGQYLHPKTAVEVAKSLTQSAAPEEAHAQLSSRELQVVKGIATGQTVKELAFQLGISDKTVATYLRRIREKMGLSSHVEIARYALEHGLVR